MNITSLPTTAGEPLPVAEIKPVWIRLPEVVRLYGLSRTKAMQLSQAGKIQSVSLREQGMTKATRLFNVASLEAFIESFLPEGENKGGTEA